MKKQPRSMQIMDFFTSNDEIIKDLKGVFEHLEGGGKSKPDFKQLLVAQFNLRPDLEKTYLIGKLSMQRLVEKPKSS